MNMSRANFYSQVVIHRAWAAATGNKYSPAQIAVAKESWLFWKSVDVPDMQAACLLACQCRETSFLPKAVGDNGEAKGAFQWHEARRDAILGHAGFDVWSGVNEDALLGAHAEMTMKWPGNMYWHDFADLLAATTQTAANTVLIHEYEQSGSQASDLAKQMDFSAYWLKYAQENWK